MGSWRLWHGLVACKWLYGIASHPPRCDDRWNDEAALGRSDHSLTGVYLDHCYCLWCSHCLCLGCCYPHVGIHPHRCHGVAAAPEKHICWWTQPRLNSSSDSAGTVWNRPPCQHCYPPVQRNNMSSFRPALDSHLQQGTSSGCMSQSGPQSPRCCSSAVTLQLCQ